MLNAICDITFSVNCYISESKCNSKRKKVASDQGKIIRELNKQKSFALK